MEVRLLGTGAADGIPAFFAESRVCDAARQRGGKDVRTRASALVDGHLKLDFGPDTFSQIVAHGVNPRDWSAILFTHSDADHFSVKELQYALFPFTEALFASFAVFANPSICAEIVENYPEWPLELHETRSFQPFQHAEYSISPLRAYHSRGEDCQNLVIDDGESVFLYATDTGVWQEETWDYLADFRLDALCIECTNGKERSKYWGHLNIEELLQVVGRLRSTGVLKPGSRVVTTHHSHEGDMTHDELFEALAPHGIEPGYDGMVLDVSPVS